MRRPLLTRESFSFVGRSIDAVSSDEAFTGRSLNRLVVKLRAVICGAGSAKFVKLVGPGLFYGIKVRLKVTRG